MPTFGDQVYQHGGVPVGTQLPFIAGNTYFVSSLTGSSSNDGTKDKPYNTVTRAMAFCTINDCLVLLPGHVETITTSADFAMNQAGMTVWGVGNYDYRPTFTAGATAGFANITAANVHIHNLKFVAGASGTAHAIKIEAKGFKATNCMFQDGAPASSMFYDEVIITGATAGEADGLRIEYCQFEHHEGISTGCIIIGGAQNDVRIYGNRISGSFTSGAGPIYGDSTVAIYGLDVGWNMIANAESSVQQVGITFDSKVGFGYIYHNYIQAESSGAGGATPIVVVNATCTIGCFENYHSGESGESGLLTPVAYAT